MAVPPSNHAGRGSRLRFLRSRREDPAGDNQEDGPRTPERVRHGDEPRLRSDEHSTDWPNRLQDMTPPHQPLRGVVASSRCDRDRSSSRARHRSRLLLRGRLGRGGGPLTAVVSRDDRIPPTKIIDFGRPDFAARERIETPDPIGRRDDQPISIACDGLEGRRAELLEEPLLRLGFPGPDFTAVIAVECPDTTLERDEDEIGGFREFMIAPRKRTPILAVPGDRPEPSSPPPPSQRKPRSRAPCFACRTDLGIFGESKTPATSPRSSGVGSRLRSRTCVT